MSDNQAQVLAEVLAERCSMGGCLYSVHECPLKDALCEDVAPQHWLDYAAQKEQGVKDAAE